MVEVKCFPTPLHSNLNKEESVSYTECRVIFGLVHALLLPGLKCCETASRHNDPEQEKLCSSDWKLYLCVLFICSLGACLHPGSPASQLDCKAACKITIST